MGYRGWLGVAGLLAGASLLAAAAWAGPAKTGGTLRIGLPREVDSLDPAIAYGADTWALEFATCAKLYSYPDKPAPAGAIVAPEIAAGFPRVSTDGKTQTIALRRTYRFHTGARITAANFVAAFNRDADPKLQSPATNFLHEIAGADAVVDGKAQTISGVRALDSYTLQVRTTQPLPDLVFRLAMPFFCPIPTGTPPREIDDPLGSGPYYVASHVPNRQIVLERNPSYRGPRPRNVDRIVWTITAPEACRQALEQDEQDYCIFISAGDRRQIVARYGVNRPNGRFFFNPTLGTYYFAFNHDRPAFKGPGQIPLKQAINLAVDRHALATAGGYLGGKRTDQILPPALGREASIYPLGGVSERSLARARALYAKAAFKPQKLVLYTHNLGFKGVNPVWAQIFQYDLKRLGIEVEIKYFPTFGELISRVGTRGEPFDVVIFSWTADYPDGIAFFGPLLDGDNLAPSGNLNVAYFDRPKVNREIARIERMTGEARRKAWADLDVELMRDDPPWVPFLEVTSSDYVSKSFGCFVFQPAFGFVDLVAACKK